jgi:hypothetical protein
LTISVRGGTNAHEFSNSRKPDESIKIIIDKAANSDSISQYDSVFYHSHLLQPNDSNSDNASIYKPSFTNTLIFFSLVIVICFDGRFGFNSA